MKTDFYQTSSKALKNPSIFHQHRNVMDRLSISRKLAVESTKHFEEKREQAHQTRLHALNRLPQLLNQFEEKALQNAFHVHWADTATDANQIVLDLLQKNQAKLVLKGKSMISEEMHLNQFLDKYPFEIVESDLGELIVQVANEHPSHIIAPAVHKNTAQIASLFNQKLGMPYSEKIEDLIQFARSYMRGKYSKADAGITGVNFAVAETGTLCLVENEGNGRFSTTVPKLHIALMSLDKVIPKLSDLPLLLELLTKSATGQKITSYVNLISSPRKKGEKDGPEQVHVIILNNGRTEILKDPLLRETLKCIRCGACINTCPVYVNIGGHAYNTVIPGPIGKILMPQLIGMEKDGVLATASSLCGACVQVCPVKIPITNILLKLREQRISWAKKRNRKDILLEEWSWKIWAKIFASPLLYKIQRKKMGLLFPFVSTNLPVLKRWTKFRSKPKISPVTLAELVKQEDWNEK